MREFGIALGKFLSHQEQRLRVRAILYDDTAAGANGYEMLHVSAEMPNKLGVKQSHKHFSETLQAREQVERFCQKNE